MSDINVLSSAYYKDMVFVGDNPCCVTPYFHGGNQCPLVGVWVVDLSSS